MDDRGQFTFYSSFARAAERIKKKSDRCDFYDIVKDYALYEKSPSLDEFTDAVAVAFELIKPTLDASRKKANNGRKGGKAGANGKQNGSKTEANGKRGETVSEKEKENENENEIEVENENECYNLTPSLPSGSCGSNAGARAEAPPPPLPHPPQSVAVAYYLRHINANASGECLRELLDFERKLGGDVAVCALKAAQDEQVTKWTYIRSILNAYVADGVRSVDDVRRREQQRDQRRSGQHTAPRTADRNAQFATHDAPLTPMEQRAVARALGKED